MPAIECASIAIVAARSVALAIFEEYSRIAAKSRLKALNSVNRSQSFKTLTDNFTKSAEVDFITEKEGSSPSTDDFAIVKVESRISDLVASFRDVSDPFNARDECHSNSISKRRNFSSKRLLSSNKNGYRKTFNKPVQKDKSLMFQSFKSNPSQDLSLAIKFLEKNHGKLISISTVREIIEVEQVAVLTQLKFENITIQQWGSSYRNKTPLAKALYYALEDSVIASVVDFSSTFKL